MSALAQSPGERSGGSWAAPWCLWLLGLLTAFRPALRSGFRLLQIGPGDPRLIQYLIEHSWRFVLRRPLHTSLWDAPFFYPVEGVVAYTDPLFGAVAPYGLFRLLGLPPGPAFQLWMMTCLSLCFLAVYLLLTRALGVERWSSAVGAFLTGFGISRVANLNDPQLFTLFWGLFGLVTLARALEAAAEPGISHAPRWVAATAALLVLQAWSAFYPAFFFAIVLAIAAAISLLLPACRPRLLRLLVRHPLACAMAILGAGVALLPLALAHLAAVHEVGWRRWSDVEPQLPPLRSWIFPGERNWIYSQLGVARYKFTGSPAQYSNGLGLVTTLVSACGLWLARKRPIAQVTLLTTAVVIVLATSWPSWGSLWTVVWHTVPGARAIRYPSRIGMLLSIAGSIGLAFALDFARSRVPRTAVVGVALLCVLEQQRILGGGYDDDAYRAAARRIADTVAPDCEAFYLWHRGPVGRKRDQEDRDRWTQLAAMWVALDAGVPTINGFAGNAPSGWALENARSADQGPPGVARDLERWASERGIRGRVCPIEVVRDQMPWWY